ncbi:MAG: hypothetical protein HC799_08580, partial [Limnothrix sp. RL_2_0]|nr:hypothetical protein [Limnothrix sp. RL_2_0]
IANSILENIRDLAIASVGIRTWTPKLKLTVELTLEAAWAIAPNTLIECCDQALYAAKEQGRDR